MDSPPDIIDNVLNHRISFMPGAHTLLSTMRKHGGYAALVQAVLPLYPACFKPSWF